MEEKYIKQMQEVFEEYKNDNEVLHARCDSIISEFLKELGYTKIVKLYDELEEYFWYS